MSDDQTGERLLADVKDLRPADRMISRPGSIERLA